MAAVDPRCWFNPAESGLSVAPAFRERGRSASVDGPRLSGVLVAVALALALATAPALAAPEGPEPGERAGSAVSLQQSAVDGAVAAAELRERLAALEGDQRRRSIERRLDDIEETVTSLERRADRLEAATPNADVERFVADRERADRTLAALDRAARSDEHGERVSELRTRLRAAHGAAREAVARFEGDDDSGLPPLAREDVATSVERGLADAPDVFYRIVAGERVEFTLQDGDGSTATFHGTVEDRRLRAVGEGPSDDETLRVHADAATFRRLQRTDRPASVLRQGLASGDVRYEGVGVAGRTKYGTIDAARFAAASVGAFLDAAGQLLGIS